MEFKIGDKVVWLKRIPWGDYVYPVAGKIIGFTEKRVKIKADDDGDIGIRYVQRENLQKLTQPDVSRYSSCQQNNMQSYLKISGDID